MRIIKNLDDSRTKYGDTNTIFRLNLLNNEELVDTTNKTLRLNIANESGLVLSKEITTDFSGYIELDFSDPELQKLTPDHYLLEYEYTLPDGDVAKYPTTGGLAFTITSNLKETNGSLVPNITFDEVLTAVDEKIAVYLATVKKGDKGDTGDTGERGNDGIDGKNGQDSDVMQSKDNIFTGSNTFTQPINGVFNTRLATFTDLAVVAKNMTAYAGVWYVVNQSIANSPMSGWYTITVIPTTDPGAGFIKVVSTAYWQGVYITNVGSGTLGAWVRLAENGSVIHNTGNETADGTKTFIKQITASGGIKGDLIGNATTANDPNAVHKTGNETVAGNKSLTGNNSFFGNTSLTDTTVSGLLSVTGSLPQQSFSKTFLGTNFNFNFVKQGQLIFMSCYATSKTTINSGTFTSLFTSIYPSGWEPAYNQQGGIVLSDSTTSFPIFINTGDISIRGNSIPSGTANLTINVFYIGKVG